MAPVRSLTTPPAHASGGRRGHGKEFGLVPHFVFIPRHPSLLTFFASPFPFSPTWMIWPGQISFSSAGRTNLNMMKSHIPQKAWDIVEMDPAGSVVRSLQRMAFGLLPSFLRQRVRPGLSKPQRLHPTSYLDGLRGVASFVVFMGHYTEENLGWFTEPYGLYEDGAPSSPLQLPFLRVIYSARPMVGSSTCVHSGHFDIF